MNGCVAVKDTMLNILWGGGPDTRLADVETVLDLLERTVGFFCDCEYEYKGCEIAGHCLKILNAEDTTNHHRVKRINRLQHRCWKLESSFHQHKVERQQAEREQYDKLQAELPAWEAMLA